MVKQRAASRLESGRTDDLNVKPSMELEAFWCEVSLRTRRKRVKALPDAGGKWMVFVPAAEVDEWWEKIRTAVLVDRLAGYAKCATARPNPNARRYDQRVICIYTDDAENEAEAKRVREALRDLGVTWKIGYKSDAATLAGVYAQPGTRVSKRWG
jgi:hypothetical protein